MNVTMSVHDPSPPRKHRRLGLWLPFGILAVVIAAWSLAWVWARGEAGHRMDAAVADLGRAGYQVSWKTRAIGGYPFRLEVTLADARVREPSGWALRVPSLEGEAYIYDLTHWMFVAPQGLTFVRPVGGPVQATGRLIRASLSHPGARPPSFDLQGLDLVFQPAPGAQPFFLSAAKTVEFHLRAGPDDEGGVFASVDQGKAQPSGLFGRIAGDKPVSIVWNSTLSKMSAFAGADWAEAVRRWSDAGGTMTVRDASLAAGQALVSTKGGTLGVDRDGRLRGALELSLRQAPQALGAMSENGLIPQAAAHAAAEVAQARQGDGDTAHATLTFQAGQTTLGPVALAPAPRIYDAR
jgi:hypothetical protein